VLLVITVTSPLRIVMPLMPPRYRLGLQVNVQNLTNHANYTGYSGVMTSPFFRQPSNVMGTRKIDIGLNFSF
jgi:hypothetical protein